MPGAEAVQNMRAAADALNGISQTPRKVVVGPRALTAQVLVAVTNKSVVVLGRETHDILFSTGLLKA